MAPPTHLDGSLLVTVQSWCFGGSKLMAWLIFGYVSSPTMHEMPSSPAKANARGTTCLLLILLLVGYVRFTADSKAGAWLGLCVCGGRSITSAASDRSSAPASLQPPWLRLSLSLSLSVSLSVPPPRVPAIAVRFRCSRYRIDSKNKKTRGNGETDRAV